MPTYFAAVLLIASSAGAAWSTPRGASHLPAPRHVGRAVRISTNDNRVAGGVLRGNLLTIHLVARVGMWYPDGDAASGTLVV